MLQVAQSVLVSPSASSSCHSPGHLLLLMKSSLQENCSAEVASRAVLTEDSKETEKSLGANLLLKMQRKIWFLVFMGQANFENFVRLEFKNI
jgi:hypothetical protein